MSDVKFRKKGQRGHYAFREEKCIEADCWTPGEYHSRGATGSSGSRATGHSTLCCVRRAYHGCPNELVHIDSLRADRKKEGWKRV